MIMVCEYFEDSRVELLPDFYSSYPNMVKFGHLMNSVNFEVLKKISALAVLSVKFIHPAIANYHFLCCF